MGAMTEASGRVGPGRSLGDNRERCVPDPRPPLAFKRTLPVLLKLRGKICKTEKKLKGYSGTPWLSPHLTPGMLPIYSPDH